MCYYYLVTKYYIYRIKNHRFGIPEPLITRSLDKRQTQFKLPSLWIHTSLLQSLTWKSRSFFAGKCTTKQQQIKRKILAVLLVSDGSGMPKSLIFGFSKRTLEKYGVLKTTWTWLFLKNFWFYKVEHFEIPMNKSLDWLVLNPVSSWLWFTKNPISGIWSVTTPFLG